MPQPDGPLTGGCQCGAVRFRAAAIGTTAICHCRMCQKAFGSYFGPLVLVGDVAWTRGTPKFYRSSNRMERGFCIDCGTPLCCVDDDGLTELAAGAFDDPSAVAPTVQYNLSSKLELFDTLASLPRQPREDLEHAANATIVGCQHPDHDTAIWPEHGAYGA